MMYQERIFATQARRLAFVTCVAGGLLSSCDSNTDPVTASLPSAGPSPLALQVSGGELTLNFDDTGAVNAVDIAGRELPLSSDAGGISIRELTGANVPVGAALYDDGFESPFEWDVHLMQEASCQSTDEQAVGGTRSLKCQRAAGPTNKAYQGVHAYSNQVLPVQPGKCYRLQAVIKATRGYLSYLGHSIQWQRNAYRPGIPQLNGLGVHWTDEDGQIPVDLSSHQLVVPFNKQADAWKAVGGEFVVPADKHHLRLALTARFDTDYVDEGFYVDEMQLFECPAELAKVTGELTATHSGLEFTGAREGLAVDATWSALPDAIEVAGMVHAIDDHPHAFDLVVSIPIDATGWTWPDSTLSQRTVEQGNPMAYENAVSADTQGYLPISLYPYGGIHDERSALAAAVPLEPISTSLIRYDAARGALDVVFHGAVAPALSHRSASFRLRFFAPSPTDGFRGFIHHYRQSYADRASWFASDFDTAPYEYWSFMPRVPLAATPKSLAEQSAVDEDRNFMSVLYTVAEFTVGRLANVNQGQSPPTLEELFVKIDEYASNPPETLLDIPGATEAAQYYYGELVPQFMRDTNGDPLLKFIAERDWTGGYVQGVLKLDPSPIGTADGLHKYLADRMLGPSFTATTDPPAGVSPSVLDTVQLDNFLSDVVIDHAAEHISRSSHDLTYSIRDYQPGLPEAASHVDLLVWLQQWLAENVEPPVRGVQINWKGLGVTNFALPWIDLCAGEVGNAIVDGAYGQSYYEENFDPEILAYKRALAFHKQRGIVFEGSGITASDIVQSYATALRFGMSAGFKSTTVFTGEGDYEQSEQLAREHNGRVAKLQRAGWQPRTLATGTEGIALERFGTSEAGTFYLVVHNPGEQAVSGTITLSSELALAAQPTVKEVLDEGQPVEVGGSGPEWSFTLTDLPPRRSLLFEITSF